MSSARHWINAARLRTLPLAAGFHPFAAAWWPKAPMRSTARCWPYAPPPRWPCKCQQFCQRLSATPATAPIRRCGRGRCAWWPLGRISQSRMRAGLVLAALLCCALGIALLAAALARRCRHRNLGRGLAAVAAAGRGGHCGGFRLHRRPRANPTAITAGRFFGVAVFRLAGRARQRVAAKRAIAPFLRLSPATALGALVQHGAQPQQYARHQQRYRPLASAPSPRGSAFRRPSASTPRFLAVVRVVVVRLWLPPAFHQCAQGRLKAILLLLAFIHLCFLKKAPVLAAHWINYCRNGA